MPDWWQQNYGVMGLPFSKWVQVTGRPDSGKTTLALLAIKRAQEQGFAVIYVETEDKTSERDLIAAGVDPSQLMIIRTNITEEVYEGVTKSLDAFFDKYPQEKVLLVVDSYGQTTSMRDSELDMTAKVAQVGGHAKANRLGLGAIASRQRNFNIAVLIVNYTYDNIGSVGETSAGGRGLEFFSSLIISAKPFKADDKQRQGAKVKTGAFVKWTVRKNHLCKGLEDADGKPVFLPKIGVFRIDHDGLNFVENAV